MHWKNPPAVVGGKTVKATDPLAAPGNDLYYVHSKTAYYNSFFFEYWDNCFSKTFNLVCPFYEYKSAKEIETLLAAKFDMYAVSNIFNT